MIKISIATATEIKAAMGDDCPFEITDGLDRENEISSDEPMIVHGVAYTKLEHKRFILDLQDEFEIELYHGRGYWVGPAVRCDSINEVTSITDVPCLSDNMGRGYIVYPIRSVND